MGKHKRYGFTIIELLIVVVMIAILAAISAVAYNGMQQRARSSTKVSNVVAATNLISLYLSEHNTFPVHTNGSYCLTVDNLCTGYDGTTLTSDNAPLMSALRSYGNPPMSSGDASSLAQYYGIEYSYSDTRTLGGIPNPVLIVYWLDGIDQMCANTVGGMISVKESTGTDMVPSARGKADTGTGRTGCYLMFGV